MCIYCSNTLIYTFFYTAIFVRRQKTCIMLYKMCLHIQLNHHSGRPCDFTEWSFQRCFASKKTTTLQHTRVPVVPTVTAIYSWLFFFSYSCLCSLLSYRSCPLHQVTLSSLSEQQAVTVQRRALSLLADTHPSFVDGLINIYRLNTLDPAILRLNVVSLQALNCYKEVSASFGGSQINAETKAVLISTLCFCSRRQQCSA